MNTYRTPAPRWFTIVAVLLILWGLAGCASFYMHVAFDPDDPGPATAYDRNLYRSLPAWLDVVFFVAVGAGLLGSILLLLRSRWALPAYVASLVAVVVQFGWTLGMTDLLAVKGPAEALGPPVLICALALLQVWLARRAKARGWIA